MTSHPVFRERPTQSVTSAAYSLRSSRECRQRALNELVASADDPADPVPVGPHFVLSKILYRRPGKAFIIGHIPPGYADWQLDAGALYPRFNERFLNMIGRYRHVIAGQFYGHWHTDSFRLFRDEFGEVVGSAFTAPSLTPYHGPAPVNPSVRLYSYRRDDCSMLDYSQYMLNLTQVNSSSAYAITRLPTSDDSNATLDARSSTPGGSTGVMRSSDGTPLSHLTIYHRPATTISATPLPLPVWRLEYRATAAYSIADLTTGALSRLYERLAVPTGGDALFRAYYERNLVGHVVGAARRCDAACVTRMLCAISETRGRGYRTCVGITSSSAAPAADAAGSSGSILRSISQQTMQYVVIVVATLGVLSGVAAVFLCVRRQRAHAASQYERIATLSVDWAESGRHHNGVTIQNLPEVIPD
ncbi:PREDICTED: uncharacterized protein LOC106813494 [Priapulus caudatus]|uniref:Uncharacterized protein LOC106813494 n=1 Tax=Priapulus caudatus TaxID=37621 RepID=A0ABM1ELQ3_PRICU|nr:PREDICTED: uncharacterized protein LOC106813494 [Priapulus caudatus]